MSKINHTYQQLLNDLIKLENDTMTKSAMKAKWTGNKWPTKGVAECARWEWKKAGL